MFGGAKRWPPSRRRRWTIGSSTKPSPRLLHSGSGSVAHASTCPVPTLRLTKNARPSENEPSVCAASPATGICRRAISSRASGSGVPLSVRASGPSRSSHAVMRKGASFGADSTAPHVTPSGPAPSPPGGRQSSTPPAWTHVCNDFATASDGAGAAQMMNAVSFHTMLSARAAGSSSAVRSVRVLSGAVAKRMRWAAVPSPTTTVFNGTGGA